MSLQLAELPLQMGPNSVSLVPAQIDEIWTALEHFEGLDHIFWITGLVLVILGFMAWQMNKTRTQRRSWGFRLFGIGILFAVIGANYSGFWNLMYHVFTQ
jgi:uncharacterized membrane protein YecN with MAPEG domain